MRRLVFQHVTTTGYVYSFSFAFSSSFPAQASIFLCIRWIDSHASLSYVSACLVKSSISWWAQRNSFLRFSSCTISSKLTLFAQEPLSALQRFSCASSNRTENNDLSLHNLAHFFRVSEFEFECTEPLLHEAPSFYFGSLFMTSSTIWNFGWSRRTL